MKLEIIKNSKIWFILSGSLILTSFIFIIFSFAKFSSPVKLGLDFTGGSKIEYVFQTKTLKDQNISSESIQQVLSEVGLNNSTSINLDRMEMYQSASADTLKIAYTGDYNFYDNSDFFKGIGRMGINELVFGLPLSLKYYLKPLAKGFNLKNMVILVGKLVLTKAIGTVVFGAIGAFIRYGALMATMGFTNFTPEECKQLAFKSWIEEMQKYKDLDFTEMVKDVVSVDKSRDYSVNRATATEEPERAIYASEINQKYGPLRLKGVEFVGELISVIGSLPTQSEINTYRIKLQTELNDKTTKTLNEKNQKYQDLFYSLDEETQAGAAGSNFKKIMEENEFFATSFTESQRKLFVDRLFYRNHFVGGIPDYKLLDSVDKIRNTFLTITNYAPDACVCKKPLAYTEKDI